MKQKMIEAAALAIANKDREAYNLPPLEDVAADGGAMDKIIRDLGVAFDVFRDMTSHLIWNDERACLEALRDLPTDAHLNGKLGGLQRSRDIVNGVLVREDSDGDAEAVRESKLNWVNAPVITLRCTTGSHNTLRGPIHLVLDTHLAKDWVLESIEPPAYS